MVDSTKYSSAVRFSITGEQFKETIASVGWVCTLAPYVFFLMAEVCVQRGVHAESA